MKNFSRRRLVTCGMVPEAVDENGSYTKLRPVGSESEHFKCHVVYVNRYYPKLRHVGRELELYKHPSVNESGFSPKLRLVGSELEHIKWPVVHENESYLKFRQHDRREFELGRYPLETKGESQSKFSHGVSGLQFYRGAMGDFNSSESLALTAQGASTCPDTVCQRWTKERRSRTASELNRVSRTPANEKPAYKVRPSCVHSADWLALVVVAFSLLVASARATDDTVRTSASAVLRERAKLPCDVTSPLTNDRPVLILWYRDSAGTPIYSFDARKTDVSDGTHWSDTRLLSQRAYFQFLPPTPWHSHPAPSREAYPPRAAYPSSRVAGLKPHVAFSRLKLPYDPGSRPPYDSGGGPPYDSDNRNRHDSASGPSYDSGSGPLNYSGTKSPYDSSTGSPNDSGNGASSDSGSGTPYDPGSETPYDFLRDSPIGKRAPYEKNDSPYTKNNTPYDKDEFPYTNNSPYDKNKSPYDKTGSPLISNDAPYGKNLSPYEKTHDDTFTPSMSVLAPPPGPGGAAMGAQLELYPVQDRDQAVYRCRVDFLLSPTKNTIINFTVIIPPQAPEIYNDSDHLVGGGGAAAIIGPYNEGQALQLSCHVQGGRPPPQVRWLLDDVEVETRPTLLPGGVVKSTLLLPNLTRAHLHSVLECQASNSDSSPPLSTAVTLDMNFEPVNVSIVSGRPSLSSGGVYELVCRAWGARPPAVVSWWRGGTQQLTGAQLSASVSLLFFQALRNAASTALSAKRSFQKPFSQAQLQETCL